MTIKGTSEILEINAKLDAIIGMETLKAELRTYLMRCLSSDWRREMGVQYGLKRPVLVFLGNPGTGKTSVAAIVAGKIFM